MTDSAARDRASAAVTSSGAVSRVGRMSTPWAANLIRFGHRPVAFDTGVDGPMRGDPKVDFTRSFPYVHHGLNASCWVTS
jgi:hypothetical protein